MESSCTVNTKTFLHKNKYFHGKELHCKPSYTKINTLIERSCTVNLTQKHFHGKIGTVSRVTNTFMERSCTVNLLTQKQTLSMERSCTVNRVTQK